MAANRLEQGAGERSAVDGGQEVEALADGGQSLLITTGTLTVKPNGRQDGMG
jgi:hypothetical protein